jgi:hypothetical protein
MPKNKIMKNKKTLLSIARVWGFISMLFLSFMLLIHLFGEESMGFTNRNELLTFIFFPLGIIFGLFVSYRSAFTGGIICLISIILSCWMIPELMKSFYYLFSVVPGVLFLIYGFKKLKVNSK